MLSFLIQLDNSLKAGITDERKSVPARSKPKVEIRIANRIKHNQDGYGLVLSWKFLNNPPVQNYSCAHIKVSTKVETREQSTVRYITTS